MAKKPYGQQEFLDPKIKRNNYLEFKFIIVHLHPIYLD